MDRNRTYTILVHGWNISEPVDFIDDLPEWLGELIIDAQDEMTPSGVQQAALTLLLARATELYRDYHYQSDVTIRKENIRLIDTFKV